MKADFVFICVNFLIKIVLITKFYFIKFEIKVLKS